MDKNNELTKILLNTIERPSSDKVLKFNEKEIIQLGNKIGYPFCNQTIGQIFSVHKSFMPILESGVINILSNEESKKPDYYIFARDGELLFDAFKGLSKGKSLEKRIHYLKCSSKIKFDKNYLEYLKKMGITKSRFNTGPDFIFIDSGFHGSLFYKIAKSFGLSEQVSNLHMGGYLICAANKRYKEVLLTKNQSLIDPLKSQILNSPYKYFSEGNFNYMLCAFMQLIPKFNGRYVSTYQKRNGSWDILPEINLFHLEKNIPQHTKFLLQENKEQVNSIEFSSDFINEDIVNPVASILLQKRTLEYFSNPKTHNRVYSSIKK